MLSRNNLKGILKPQPINLYNQRWKNCGSKWTWSGKRTFSLKDYKNDRYTYLTQSRHDNYLNNVTLLCSILLVQVLTKHSSLLHPFLFLQPAIHSTTVLYLVFSKVVQCLYSDDKHCIINGLISKPLTVFYDPELQTESFPQVWDDSILF